MSTWFLYSFYSLIMVSHGAVFVLLTKRKKRDAEKTAKPRRNCSGETLLLIT